MFSHLCIKVENKVSRALLYIKSELIYYFEVENVY